jgi:two-component system phosphate regulon sensor histidine kinase PhoR
MKSDFINNMTHEFKTPITTISLASEALKNESNLTDTIRQRFANMIFEENKRLESQVERVLQMARLEKGEVKLTYSDVNVHEIIQNVIQKVNLHVEKHGGILETHLRASKPIIQADAMHLTNMLYNFVDNAIKYSPDELKITIATENTPDGIQIQVSDKGMGMSSDQQRKIFDKFYRIPGATKNRHDVKGFGLGLSYVKMIAEAHNGNVRVRSELKKGSTFSLVLPFVQNTPEKNRVPA